MGGTLVLRNFLDETMCMPVNSRDSTGTSRDKQGQRRDNQGQDRDKQGQAGTFPLCPCLSLLVPLCPCLSMLVPACPCLSLSYLVCPYLSLYVSTFALPSCLPLEMNITFFISMSIVTLTFLAKALFQCMQTLFVTFSLLFIMLPQ